MLQIPPSVLFTFLLHIVNDKALGQHVCRLLTPFRSAFITSHVLLLHFILCGSMWPEPLHPERPDSGVFCVSAPPRCLFSSWWVGVNPRCIPGSPHSLHAAFVSELQNFLGLHFACIIECLPQLNGSLCSFTQKGLSCS